MTRQRTSSKLGIQPIPYNPLQSQTRTHKHQTREDQPSRPGGTSALGGDTAGNTLPGGNGGGHGEESLEECTADEPETFVCTDVITVAANESTEAEGTEGGQGLLVSEVEFGVTELNGAFEETGEGYCELMNRG